MRTRIGLGLALALAACGSKKTDGGAGPSAPAVDPKAANALWALAPAKTQVGVVVADGTGPAVQAALAEVVRVLGARPGGDFLVAELRKEIASESPFDPLDPASWQRAGIDLARGAAIFTHEGEDQTLIVIPVGDRAAFRTLTEAKVETIDGREVDRLDKMLCTEAGGRYLCARELAVIDAAVAPHDSALAARVAKLAPELRGNFEIVADLAGIPDALDELKEIAPALTDIGLVAVGARLGGGAATVRFWLEGKRGAPIGTAIGKPTAAPGAALAGGGAASVMRAQVPLAMLVAQSGAPASVPVPGADLRTDLLDQLTGGFAFYAVGKTPLAGVVTMTLADAGRAGKAVKALCEAAAGNTPPGVKVEVGDGGCSARVDLAAILPAEARALGLPTPGFAHIDGSLRVKDGLLVLAVGDTGTPSGELAAAAGSPGGRDLLGGEWHGVLWSRSIDPFAGASDELMGLFTKLAAQGPGGDEGMAQVKLGRWMLAHLYEVGLAASLRDDGIHGLFQVTSFAADPPEAYQAYEAAVAKHLDGDSAGYRAALAELAAKHPDTLAGRQAVLVSGGVPVIAGSTGILAAVAIPAFMQYMKKSKASEARVQLRRMSQGARALLAEGGSGAGFGGGLPPSAGPTPPLGTCCRDGERCQPDASWWADPTWTALSFSVDDPHYYSYQFVHQDGSFTARALGDLDCDGVYSTFEVRGSAGGAPSEIISDHELE